MNYTNTIIKFGNLAKVLKDDHISEFRIYIIYLNICD